MAAMLRCVLCKHFDLNSKELICKAFDRIPDDIVFNKFVHDTRHPLQKGDYIFEFSEDIKKGIRKKD